MSRKAENGVDWVSIRAEYVTTKTSLRKLSEKYGVAKSAVDKKSQKEGWVESREAYNKSLCEKVIEKTSDEQSDKLAALIAAADEMTDVMQAALSDKDQFYRYIIDGVSVNDDETVVKKTETTFKKIDTKAVREMAAAMKDLTAVVRNLHNLPTLAEMQARELAIERFKLEKAKAEKDEQKDNKIEIVFADDATVEGWAD